MSIPRVRKTPTTMQLDELVTALRDSGNMLRKQSGNRVRTTYDEAADAITALRRDLAWVHQTVVTRADQIVRGDVLTPMPGDAVTVLNVSTVGDDVDIEWDNLNANLRVHPSAEVRRYLRNGETR